MKKLSISSKSLDPIIEKIEKLSKLQRILIYSITFLLIIGAFVGLSFYPKYDKLAKLKAEFEKLESDLRVATIKARKLKRLKEELEAAREEFKIAGKALPEKEEIPSLLASVSQSGQDANLEFLLFQPRPEINKDFYAAIPVSITVEGPYHNIGDFFDKVSNLSRIVNIQDVSMKPTKSAGTFNLAMSCTAVTYKFIDTEAKKPNNKGRKRK